jgi:hypothetical protein
VRSILGRVQRQDVDEIEVKFIAAWALGRQAVPDWCSVSRRYVVALSSVAAQHGELPNEEDDGLED